MALIPNDRSFKEIAPVQGWIPLQRQALPRRCAVEQATSKKMIFGMEFSRDLGWMEVWMIGKQPKDKHTKD
jgi:hypothetical protein